VSVIPAITTIGTRLAKRLELHGDWYLIILAMAIGVLMGAVAAAFILPLRALERLAESANPALVLWLVPIAPAVGGLLAGLIIARGSRERRSPGVSTVMYAIHRSHSQLPPRVGIIKWIASTLTIGSGGSAGAEGPIVTIGSVIGSNIGRLVRGNPQMTATLLGCGAAAGISSVFNAPIAGIFFVLEVMLRDFSMRTFTPIVIASVISAVWTQTLLGDQPLFLVNEAFFAGHGRFTLWEVPNFFLLGMTCGACAPAFQRLLVDTEQRFAKLAIADWAKPALGGAILGAIGLLYVFLWHPPHNVPQFYGNGYPIIRDLLDTNTYAAVDGGSPRAVATLLASLLLLAALKMVATTLTIGSGGSGGLFAPSLLLGAALGGAFGVGIAALGWFGAVNPAHYALVGMAAMIAGAMHAPLTGMLLVYEITRSYEIILPLMLAAVISAVLARLINRDSVYTASLAQQGVRLGAMSDLTILRRLFVADVPLLAPILVHSNDSAQKLLELSEQHSVSDFIVVDERQEYIGMVTGGDLQEALVHRESIPLLQVNELQRIDLPTVTPQESLDVVLDKFSAHDVQSLPVLAKSGNGRVVGLITRSRLMKQYQMALARDV
jgi:CIC family chloride channel protein